jgi:hypothetical protein
LDTLSTPEKRYNESTYWKRAVEYMARVGYRTPLEYIPWTPFSIAWVNSRLDEDGNIVFEWIEYLAHEKTARLYHRLNDAEITNTVFMNDIAADDVIIQFGSEFFDASGNLRVTEKRQFRSTTFYALNATRHSFIRSYTNNAIAYVENDQTVATLFRGDGGYGFAVHPSRKYMCYIDQAYQLCFYNLETRQNMEELSTSPIQTSEMVGKLYWSPDGTRLYMSHKSGIVAYSFPDIRKPPVYHNVPELIDFELSKDGSTLFFVSENYHRFLDTSFSVEERSRLRELKRSYDWEYVTACFAANRPTVYIVERRKKDNFHRVVSIHAFAALVSVPYHD